MTDTVPAEVRIALQDVMTDYCYAVDRLDHVDELLDLFTVDAVLDFSTIGLATMHGRTRWEPFYREVFAGMSHHTHYMPLILHPRARGHDDGDAEGSQIMAAYGPARQRISGDVRISVGRHALPG